MSDEAIIQALQGGDERAMDRVIDQYSRLLWSIVSAVLSRAGTEQDVEECVADVFIYVWNNPEKYDPKRGKLKVWLSVLARSQAIDRYRVLSRRCDVPLEDALAAGRLCTAEGALDREARQALHEAIQTLEEPEREILIRRYYFEQKPREIAAALALPVKQVQNRLYRAKQKLKKQLSR